MSIFRNNWLNLPSLLLAFIMAIVVWIFAVSSSDPVEERIYSKPIPIEIKNLDEALIITNDIPEQVFITLKAPRSIWEQIENEQGKIEAYLDLSDVKEGTYTAKTRINIDVQPVELVSASPASIELTLHPLSIKDYSIRLIRRGEPAIGYQAEVPKLGQTTAKVSGPEEIVSQIKGIIATLDLAGTDTDINRTIELQAVDENDNVLKGIEISPSQIIVSQSINQLGGYRNLAVKVVVKGQISVGYRLTSISAFPAAVTVFSSNPEAVNDLPGYVETQSIDVSGIKDDLDVQVPLALPANVSVVGEETVQVQVGVAAIEGSMTWDNMAVTITGLDEGLKATTSPENVDVIISGPLPTLDSLQEADIQVYVDLSGKPAGTYQRVPRVDLAVADLRITSILPESIEVTINEDTSAASGAEENNPMINKLSPTPTAVNGVASSEVEIPTSSATPHNIATPLPTETPFMTIETQTNE